MSPLAAFFRCTLNLREQVAVCLIVYLYCASIFRESTCPVNISSHPGNVDITPATLKAGPVSHRFMCASFSIVLRQPGPIPDLLV